MTTPFNESDHPRGAGGQFAPKARSEQARLDAPYGDGHPWNQDAEQRERLEVELAGQIATVPHFVADPRACAARIFQIVAVYRGVPSEVAEAATPDAVAAASRGGPSGEGMYRAMLPVIDAAQAREYAPKPQPDRIPDVPTLGEVEAAKAYLDALEPVRQMYRPDWERRNGGYGPTVAQVRTHAHERSLQDDRIRAAKVEYDRLKAAYDAANG